MLLILVLKALIVVKVAAADAPCGQHLTTAVFRLPDGAGLSTLALASTVWVSLVRRL